MSSSMDINDRDIATSAFLSQKEKALDVASSNDTSSCSDSMETGDETSRGNWSGRLDFFLSCVGYAVGLGNIWRFPYLCYKSGGGAFLIPYVIFLFLCGIPMVFLEVSFGQFASLSPVTIWRICPLFKGVGYGMVIVSGIVCVYYNIIITWTIYYLYHSLRLVLPWSLCHNWWNTEHCYLRTNTNKTVSNNKLLNSSSMYNFTTATELFNGSSPFNLTKAEESILTTPAGNMSSVLKKTASEEFWQRGVLQLSPGIEHMGNLRFDLLICLFTAWVVVFLCLCKGIKTSGKVVYVTATFPYLVLLILLIRGVTLPGAGAGIAFYLVPDWNKLTTFQVWGDAAVQIFYSVGMAWGGLITMASYNKFHNNVYRDAMVVPLINCGTSVFAGLVIFSVLGFMAHETGVDIKNVVTQGPGLAFVAYPEAIAKLPISPLWSVLFFLMLFSVGLDTQQCVPGYMAAGRRKPNTNTFINICIVLLFGMFETMSSAFIDEFPDLLKNKKALFTAFMCFVEFLLGIPCVMQGGVYVLQIMDWYCSTFSLMILSLTECIVIGWIYGVDRFYKDLEMMIGYQPCVWWKICWCFITPALILFIWLFSVTQLSPVTYGTYHYPQWAIVLGWFLGMMSLVPIPVCAILAILQEKGPFVLRVKKLIKPTDNFGPAMLKYQEKYLESLEKRESILPTLDVRCRLKNKSKGIEASSEPLNYIS